MENYLELARIRGQEFLEDTKDFLIEKYGQSRHVFSYAGSFGQILLVIQNLFKNFYFYLQHVATEKNMVTATQKDSIYGMARLAGHDPASARSSVGTAVIKWDNTKTINVYLPLYIVDGQSVKIRETSTKFIIRLSKDFEMLGGDNGSSAITCKLVQGSIEQKEFTGTAKNLQSFNILSQGNSIDKSSVNVSVNGESYKTHESLYDIPPNSKGCIIKTGINGGIDLYFGVSSTVEVPGLGSQILVEYLITSGKLGNVGDASYNTLNFVDFGISGSGDVVDLNNYLKIEFENAPFMGADSEPTSLTKLIAGMSTSQIIHDGRSLEYALRKLNMFSTVDVKMNETLPNRYDVLVSPMLVNRFDKFNSYFSSDISAFQFSDLQLDSISSHLYSSGLTSLNIDIRLVNPVIRKYVLYVMVNLFDSTNGKPLNEAMVKSNIVNVIEDHLINNGRSSKIAMSDLTAKLEPIDYMDSLRIIPISEQNELLKISGSEETTGFDNTGDIEVGFGEIAVIRGGFYDRDGNEYADKVDVKSESHTTINIIVNKISRR